jgi:hypothetical protein
LQTYLQHRSDLADLAEPMLEAAQALVANESAQITLDLLLAEPSTATELAAAEPEMEETQQLRLL